MTRREKIANRLAQRIAAHVEFFTNPANDVVYLDSLMDDTGPRVEQTLRDVVEEYREYIITGDTYGGQGLPGRDS